MSRYNRWTKSKITFLLALFISRKIGTIFNSLKAFYQDIYLYHNSDFRIDS